jgi:hypothetical protein
MIQLRAALHLSLRVNFFRIWKEHGSTPDNLKAGTLEVYAEVGFTFSWVPD